MEIATSLPVPQGQGAQHSDPVGLDACGGKASRLREPYRGSMHAGRLHMGVGTFCLGLGQISKEIDAQYGYDAGTIREAFLEHVHVAGQALPPKAQMFLRTQT